MHWLYHTVKYLLVHWGYWAVIAGLLAESAGVPVPGETTLMFASFLARKSTGLHLWLIILCGIAAATLGDNLGFWIGDKLGSTLIRWIKKVFHMDDQDIAAAKDLIRHHGAKTIFFARFIFGLRTVAAPLAGVLGMEWRRFVLFNFLGAATWVTCIAVSGYLFATQFQTLLDFSRRRVGASPPPSSPWAISSGGATRKSLPSVLILPKKPPKLKTAAEVFHRLMPTATPDIVFLNMEK